MSCDGISRIKYYQGQMLTARDFQDEQDYHRQKHSNLLRRFPYGIIGGLEVTCAEKDEELPGDYDGFLIKEGLAVDDQGNEIIVPEQGYKVPLTEFDPNKPYLSFRYIEEETQVGNGVCGASTKNNRIQECFSHSWDTAPNISPSITVALIEVVDENAGSCGDFSVQLTEEEGGPRIRIDAQLIDTEQIADSAIVESKIRTNAVTSMKINDGAVSEAKLSDGAVSANKLDSAVQSRLVTQGDLHDHTENSGGSRIPVNGLQSEVQGKLVTNGDTHNHIAGNGGALIPENGLDTSVQGKLVTNGNTHNHTSGDGAKLPLEALATDISGGLVSDGNQHDHTAGSGGKLIPETGLATNVRGKLVTTGDSHDHTSGHGAKIPLAALADEIADQFITDGNLHNHTSDSGGALIPEGGLEAAVQNKLVTSGNTHDHTSGAGAQIPESGLTTGVISRLVTEGDAHDHTAGHGAPVPTAGLADMSVTSPKLNLVGAEYNQIGTVDVEGVALTVRIQGPESTNVWIPHVIPRTPGTRLRWTYDVEYEKNEVMAYHVNIVNQSSSPGEYFLRFVNLNV